MNFGRDEIVQAIGRSKQAIGVRELTCQISKTEEPNGQMFKSIRTMLRQLKKERVLYEDVYHRWSVWRRTIDGKYKPHQSNSECSQKATFPESKQPEISFKTAGQKVTLSQPSSKTADQKVIVTLPESKQPEISFKTAGQKVTLSQTSSKTADQKVIVTFPQPFNVNTTESKLLTTLTTLPEKSLPSTSTGNQPKNAPSVLQNSLPTLPNETLPLLPTTPSDTLLSHFPNKINECVAVTCDPQHATQSPTFFPNLKRSTVAEDFEPDVKSIVPDKSYTSTSVNLFKTSISQTQYLQSCGLTPCLPMMMMMRELPPALPSPPYVVTVIDATTFPCALRIVQTNCICLRRFIITTPDLLVQPSSDFDVIDVIQRADADQNREPDQPVTAAFRILSLLMSHAHYNQFLPTTLINIFSRDPLVHNIPPELTFLGIDIEIVDNI